MIATIKILKQHFARYGIPDILMTDNGPQFTSHEFRFLQETGKFNTTLAALHSYAKSNGKAENSVKTAKQLMREAIEAKADPYLAMLDFRNTPTEETNKSAV